MNRKCAQSYRILLSMTPACLKWNCERSENRVVPEDVIMRMYNNYEPPTSEEFDEIIYIDPK